MDNPLTKLSQETCFSVTGSDPAVMRACLKYALKKNSYFCCEATVNQVNQFGGYTGMKPKDYVKMMCGFADEIGFPKKKLILSGDHLGPFVWQNLSADEAMKNSEDLVYEYVKAGFRKIHLDPTMPLKGDKVFGDDIIAKRAVRLAKVAEEAYESTKNDTIWDYRPVYVIGSEVPVPGGTKKVEKMTVTKEESLRKTLECFKNAFVDNGLEIVWRDTIAVVAQIGLEFSEDNVYDFDFKAASSLQNVLKDYPGIVFESHSSDYQTPKCLQEMVLDGVGILKVGPELTFAHREALFSLSMIEEELKDAWQLRPSNFRQVLERVMLNSIPNYWEKYYHGSEAQQKVKRAFSYSDRTRYYFANKEVLAAKEQLLRNLNRDVIPLYLISQYLPIQYEHIREGLINPEAQEIIDDKIQMVMDRYCRNMIIGAKKKTQI